MIKLSFIVPVYNVEKYLRKCVESLINQDYSGYEIILVDDGSTDGSGDLCDEIVRENDGMSRADALNEPHKLNDDARYTMRVIHQENGGLSAARNAGLKETRGEYVCFVDSDDYWKENVLGGLMEQLEREKLDVLRFKFQNVNEKYEVYQPYKRDERLGNDYSEEVTDGVFFLNTRKNYQCYAVMYIMRRELVPDFTEGIHFEDVDWFPRMMLHAKRVASTDAIIYNYLTRQGSITQVKGDKTKIRKNLNDRLFVLKRYMEYREQFPNCRWLHNMQGLMASGILATAAMEFYAERKTIISQLKAMHVFPLPIANQGSTYIRRARLINTLGPRIYCAIMHIRE